MKMAKNAISIQSQSSPPRQTELRLTRGASPKPRSARLGEPEAQNLLFLPRLGKGGFALAKVPFA